MNEFRKELTNDLYSTQNLSLQGQSLPSLIRKTKLVNEAYVIQDF